MTKSKASKKNDRPRKINSDNYSNVVNLAYKYLGEKREGHLPLRETIMKFMKERHLESNDVYNAVQLDRRLYNKLISCGDGSNSRKGSSVRTLLLICIGLRLTAEESEELLLCEGFAFCPYNREQMLFRFCIENEIYNFEDVLEIMESFDLSLTPRTNSTSR